MLVTRVKAFARPMFGSCRNAVILQCSDVCPRLCDNFFNVLTIRPRADNGAARFLIHIKSGRKTPIDRQRFYLFANSRQHLRLKFPIIRRRQSDLIWKLQHRR